MNSIFITVLSLSLAGSLLISIIFISLALFKGKISKRWQYYIWLVVIVRLLLPFTHKINIVEIIFQRMDSTVTNVIELSWQEDSAVKKNAGNYLENQIQADVSLRSQNNFFKVILANVWLLWFVVAVIMFVRKVTIYQSFARYVKAGRKEVVDIEKLEILGELIEQLNIKGAVDIYTNNLISSPMLIGFFHPYIVLPTLEISNSDFQYTILHELVHYKCSDMFYKWLVQLAICLHWFNPFIYLMGSNINRACEFSCDEAVIKRLNYQEIRAYGNTLMNAMSLGGSYRDSLASLTLNESKKLLRERLDMIKKFKKKSKFITAVTLVLTMFICMTATAAGAYSEPKSSKTVTPITPWEAMGGDTEQGYTYSQSSYYQAPYIFEIGWNLNDKGYEAYHDKAEIKLSDLTTLIVSFDSSLHVEAKNQEVLSALTILLEKINTYTTDSSSTLRQPLVVNVKYVDNNNLNEVVEEYYINDELTSFSAVFFALESEIQKDYIDRMFKDHKNAFLSSTLKNMDTDIINYCAEKAYLENNNAFFANIVPYLNDTAKRAWIVKATQDNKNNFLSLLK